MCRLLLTVVKESLSVGCSVPTRSSVQEWSRKSHPTWCHSLVCFVVHPRSIDIRIAGVARCHALLTLLQYYSASILLYCTIHLAFLIGVCSFRTPSSALQHWNLEQATTGHDMPSHRRGRSRSRERSRSRSRGRSESSERDVKLPNSAKPISESDYFLRSDEFRVWLKDEKDKVSYECV